MVTLALFGAEMLLVLVLSVDALLVSFNCFYGG
jgi:hypothetical protein